MGRKCQGLDHHIDCRKRIEDAMRLNGDVRLQRAEDRLDQAAERHRTDQRPRGEEESSSQPLAAAPGTPLAAGARFDTPAPGTPWPAQSPQTPQSTAGEFTLPPRSRAAAFVAARSDRKVERGAAAETKAPALTAQHARTSGNIGREPASQKESIF